MSGARNTQRINITHPMRNIRQSLGIDTWGMDIFRLKRRIGAILLDIEEIHARIDMLDKPAESRIQAPDEPDPGPCS